MNLNQAKELILKLLPYRRVFILVGALGAGKTTLTKLIAKSLKIEENLTSPTFILWQKYEFKIGRKKYFLNHLDLYRVKPEDIIKLNLSKEIFKNNNVFFIEWGEKLKSFLTKKKIKFVEVIIKRKKKKREFLIKNESFSNR